LHLEAAFGDQAAQRFAYRGEADAVHAGMKRKVSFCPGVNLPVVRASRSES